MMMNSKPIIICLTPVKNEAWILERFLRCASLWADHIIVADQASEDGSREIAQRFEKVTLIRNESSDYSEAARQRLLIAQPHREIAGPRLLVALDADDCLTANYIDRASNGQPCSLSGPEQLFVFAGSTCVQTLKAIGRRRQTGHGLSWTTAANTTAAKFTVSEFHFQQAAPVFFSAIFHAATISTRIGTEWRANIAGTSVGNV